MAAGGRTQSHRVEVMMDPRLAADGVTMDDLRAQLELSREVAATMAEAAEVNERVQAAVARAQGRTLEELQGLDGRLNTKQGGSYQRPMLLAQLQYLYSMFNRADQAPGDDAYSRHTQLREELASIIAELERLERLIT